MGVVNVCEMGICVATLRKTKFRVRFIAILIMVNDTISCLPLVKEGVTCTFAIHSNMNGHAEMRTAYYLILPATYF